jgi:hypothetical protein
MAVLFTDEVPGMTQEAYEELHAVLDVHTREASGFVLHAAGPIDGGWQVTELWESQQDREAFFEKYVTPLLPADAPRPNTTMRQIVSYTSR